MGNPRTSTSTWTLKSFASLSSLSLLWLLPKATPNPTGAVTTVVMAVMATDTLAATTDTDTDTLENEAPMPLLKPKPNLLLKPMPNLLPKPMLMPKPWILWPWIRLWPRIRLPWIRWIRLWPRIRQEICRCLLRILQQRILRWILRSWIRIRWIRSWILLGIRGLITVALEPFGQNKMQ